LVANAVAIIALLVVGGAALRFAAFGPFRCSIFLAQNSIVALIHLPLLSLFAELNPIPFGAFAVGLRIVASLDAASADSRGWGCEVVHGVVNRTAA